VEFLVHQSVDDLHLRVERIEEIARVEKALKERLRQDRPRLVMMGKLAYNSVITRKILHQDRGSLDKIQLAPRTRQHVHLRPSELFFLEERKTNNIFKLIV